MRTRCALVALLLALSVPALAKPTRPELAQAKAAFGTATTDYDAGRYDAALKGFRARARSVPQPDPVLQHGRVRREARAAARRVRVPAHVPRRGAARRGR